MIAKSTPEAKYVAANAIVNQAIQIRKILVDPHMKQNEPTQIHIGNQAAIAISNYPVSWKDQVFQYQTISLRRRAKGWKN